MKRIVLMCITVCLLSAATVGCVEEDKRLVELSQQSVARQAEQNQAIARQSQQVAEATQSLVQADAQARAEMIAAQQSLNEHLQTERTSLDRQHEDLETERRKLAAARQREPVIAQAITWSAALLAGLLPLVVVIYLLRALGNTPPDDTLNELLVCELVTMSEVMPEPTEPAPRSLPGVATPALPADDTLS